MPCSAPFSGWVDLDYQPISLCLSSTSRNRNAFRGSIAREEMNKWSSKVYMDEWEDDWFNNFNERNSNLCDYMEDRKTTKTQFQEAEAATEYWETHYYKIQNVLNPSL